MGDALLATPITALYADTWITTDLAAELLGVSQRSMQRAMAQYQTRQVPREGRGGERCEIRLASLPITAVDAWEARQRVDASREQDAGGDLFQAYQRADQRTRKYFDRWSQVLVATKDLQGRKSLDEFCAIWNREHADHQISLGSLYRVRAQVAEQGLIGLLLRDSRLPESSVRDDWFEAFCGAYLNENKISINNAHEVALGAAMRLAIEAGEHFDPTSFPSRSAFMRRLEREYSPAVIAFKRDGEKKFYDRWGYYVERDYSDLVSGRIWVGDSRVLDILVRDDSIKTTTRSWVTAFLCMKSYVPMGWHVHLSAPSAENTMRALRHGIVNKGKPDWWYLDNGREYRNDEVTGMSRGHRVDYDKQHTGSVAAMLGIQVHFAEVHNARAKPIERQFLEMKNKFDRFWSTFKGGNAVEKPNRLKETLKRESQIPTFDQVRAALDQWYSELIPHHRCNGKTHKGRTRAQVLEADYAIHGPLQSVSADTAAMLVSKMARGTIGRRGFHLASVDATWWAEWMPREKGRTVVLRYDPDDLRVAWCYEATDTGHGPLIGTCDLYEAAGAMVRPDDALGLAILRDGTRQRKAELKAMRVIAPQADAEDLERIRSDYGRGVGARPLELAQSNSVILTPYDQTASQVRREARSGRADLRECEAIWFSASRSLRATLSSPFVSNRSRRHAVPAFWGLGNHEALCAAPYRAWRRQWRLDRTHIHPLAITRKALYVKAISRATDWMRSSPRTGSCRSPLWLRRSAWTVSDVAARSL